MPVTSPGSETNAEANAQACSTFLAAACGGTGVGAENETAVDADAETETAAEIACASPLLPVLAQPQRLRPDLPPNDLRLKLSCAHC